MKRFKNIPINLFLLLIMLSSTFYVEAQNVGIGITNPTRPLSFPPVIGKKISLYPGALGDAGFGVFGNELRIHSDYLFADITFGYDDYNLGFTERMRIGNAYDVGMYLNGRIILKNGTSPLDLDYGAGIWLYKADNSSPLGFMGTQNNQNIGFYGGPVGWGFTYDAIKSRVGIGTPTPAARLHVIDSSVVFSSYNYPGSPGAPPVQGFGLRLMWYANQASLRAGFVDGTQWDQDSIGLASFAAGYNVKASGDFSVATGLQSSATGIISTAMGYNTKASAYYATALGVGSQATGISSLAGGTNTMASGEESVALGAYTVASGLNSFAAGISTHATGDNSTSFGINTKAIGLRSTVMGFDSKAIGFSSISMGSGSRSGGDFSASIGLGLNAKCYSSFVTGMYNDSVSTIDEGTSSPTSPLFIIGNGASHVSRSNAFVVLKNGNTGIGISDPGFPLNLANSFGDKISFKGVTGPHYGIGVINNLMQIHTDNLIADIAFGSGSSGAFSEVMRIKGNGAVGIGTTTPGFPLNFAGTYGDKISLYGYIGAHYGLGVQNNLLQIHTEGSNADIGFGHGSSGLFVETMRIKGNGSVGIGITTPGFPLNFAGTYGDKISLYGYFGAHYGLGVQNNLLQIHTEGSNADIGFGHGSSGLFAETMRIKGNGNVGINTTTPGSKLDINGNLRFTNVDCINGACPPNGAIRLTPNLHLNAGPDYAVIVNWDNTESGSDAYSFRVGNGYTSDIFDVFYNGDAWLAGILSGPSDLRLKKDIQPLKNSLTKLTHLTGYNFYWKNERSSAAMQTGVIAQEVQKLFPELVTEDKEGMLSVNYTGLIPVLIESTKELKQQVDQLKKQNEEIMILLHQLQENK